MIKHFNKTTISVKIFTNFDIPIEEFEKKVKSHLEKIYKSLLEVECSLNNNSSVRTHIIIDKK